MHTPREPGQMGRYAAACGTTVAAMRRVCERHHHSGPLTKTVPITRGQFYRCLTGERRWHPQHLVAMARLIGTTTAQFAKDLALIQQKRFPFKEREDWFERMRNKRKS